MTIRIVVSVCVCAGLAVASAYADTFETLTLFSVTNNDTDICPWDVSTHASRTTFVAGIWLVIDFLTGMTNNNIYWI